MKLISILPVVALVLLQAYQAQSNGVSGTSPNILYVMVDALGWNDIGYHGSSLVRTPVLNNLATKQGLRLERFYTQPHSGPTRTSFLTGKYAIHTGFQGGNIRMMQELALGEDEVLISDELRRKKYRNYMVGKWMAGFYDWKFTPTKRNFDTFFGSYGGRIQKYNHISKYAQRDDGDDESDDSSHHNCSGPCWAGVDMHNGTTCVKGNYEYTSDLYRDSAIQTLRDHQRDFSNRPFFMYFAFENIRAPMNASGFDVPNCIRKTGLSRRLNAPLSYENDGMGEGSSDLTTTTTTEEPDGIGNNYTCDVLQQTLPTEVRRHLAMVRGVDRVIGDLVEELKTSGLWENTLVIISSDGGGETFHSSGTSNYPLRGSANTLYEGGVRVPSLVTGGMLHSSQVGKTYNGYVHITDWLPTFISMAGIVKTKTKVDQSLLDGFDISKLLLHGQRPKPNRARKMVLLNLDSTDAQCNSSIFYDGVDVPLCGALIWDDWKIIMGYQSDNQRRVKSGWVERPDQRWLHKPRPSVKCGNKRKRLLTRINWPSYLQGGSSGELPCPYNGEPCLFNLARDPCETTDMKLKYPTVYAKILNKLMQFQDTEVQSLVPLHSDKTKRANPRLFDDCWMPWQGSLNESTPTTTSLTTTTTDTTTSTTTAPPGDGM
jgi:arylsulfatase A-like enzyme